MVTKILHQGTGAKDSYKNISLGHRKEIFFNLKARGAERIDGKFYFFFFAFEEVFFSSSVRLISPSIMPLSSLSSVFETSPF